ncbi:hypothetical protein M405DRAFT_803847 [Rhizopogon salebrosus TDB-379]|nr:hypothetical protein M405DRAFT_803847 [Rhizopogon salebrosus TDB-379]
MTTEERFTVVIKLVSSPKSHLPACRHADFWQLPRAPHARNVILHYHRKRNHHGSRVYPYPTIITPHHRNYLRHRAGTHLFQPEREVRASMNVHPFQRRGSSVSNELNGSRREE